MSQGTTTSGSLGVVVEDGCVEKDRCHELLCGYKEAQHV